MSPDRGFTLTLGALRAMCQQKETVAMAMDRETLENHLKDAFPEADIILTDLAGDNDHWQAEIVSPQFAGVSRVRQHQMVYAALKGKMGGELHALALKTRAPS
jgi:stress-induced morphogen